VRHPAFPKTICAVVFQGAGRSKTDCQFSFVCDGSMRATRDEEAWDKAQHIAARALSGVVLADIGNATHFHATSLGQQWGDGLVRVATVGLHVFYKFGHAHPDYQAQSIVASAKPLERSSVDVKPVLAALLPSAQAAEPPPKPQAQPEPQKDAQAGDPKPVAQAKSEAPAA